MSLMNFITTVFDSWLTERLATEKLPRPVTIHIEPVGNVCQLKCPLCPTGIRMMGPDHKIMSLDVFKAILAKVPSIKVLELYRSGEPFLNPELFAMIRFASKRDIKVTVSTHFSFSKTEDFFEEIVLSGLERLVVSLDGASQESYSRYRIGGSYDLVMSNIEKLITVKNRLQSSTPKIVWQFLVNRFNEHEIGKAGRISKSLKITLDVRPLDLDDELPDLVLDQPLEERKIFWLPKNPTYIHDRYKGETRNPLFPGICRDLFARMVVTADGKVMPCCLTWHPDNIFGDLLADSFDDVWYSRKYLDARRRFLQPDYKPQVRSICYRCNNFGTTPALRDKLKILITVYKNSLRYGRNRNKLV